MSSRPQISVVVPVHNEQESLPVLHEEIRRALGAMGAAYELIFVDDRSTDGSLRVMLELRARHPNVRIVRFRRNYGQTAALSAGFDVSRGDIVITLDGDLQNDPADIPRLVARLEQGYDIVAGWRKQRHDSFVVRRLPSLVANRLIAWFTGVPIHDTGCTLKAFRRELVKRLPIYAEQHRFLPVISAGSGARVSELVVNHRPRRFGSSKYGLGRAMRVLLDLIAIRFLSQFSRRPLHYFGILCLLFSGFGLLFAVASAFGWNDGVSLAPSATPLNRWDQVAYTIVLLLVIHTVYFALLGLLAELAVRASGMHRRSTLSSILNELH
jgi:glycosyltransferase involved in cell wall biosynthesis